MYKKSANKISLVVARYKEDVKWLHDFNTPDYRILLYNKGELMNKNDLPRNTTQISLPNVGRESHTYLYHIISNYDELSPYCVFLQGNPFDHINKLQGKALTNIENKLKQIIDIHVKSNAKTLYYFNLYYEPYNNFKELHIEQFTTTMDLSNSDKLSVFSNGAQYIVPRNLILKRDKQFYLYLLNLLKNDNNNKHPIYIPFEISNLNGYVMERLWPYIFEKI